MKTVYLCGAINGKTDDECKGWRREATRLLGDVGFSLLDPMRRDYRGREDECVDEIVRGDLEDISQSGFVLVNACAPSWGTAMETYHAYTTGKKVVAFTGGARVSPWLSRHTHAVCDSLERACVVVMNFDNMVPHQ